MKQSETRTIKRSQINLNPQNIKNHTEEQVKLQKKNLKKVGYLGGVVWNEESHNLIDGHRRLQALDSINRYDGTPETDYDIKVECVSFDRKTELEQMAYMAVGNSKADYNLIADIIDDIDYKDVGLTDADYKAITDLRVSDDFGEGLMESLTDGLVRTEESTPVTELPRTEMSIAEVMQAHEDKPKQTAEEVKAAKQFCDSVAAKHHEQADLYIVIAFESVGQKVAFCEALGMDEKRNMTVKGEDIMRALDL